MIKRNPKIVSLGSLVLALSGCIGSGNTPSITPSSVADTGSATNGSDSGYDTNDTDSGSSTYDSGDTGSVPIFESESEAVIYIQSILQDDLGYTVSLQDGTWSADFEGGTLHLIPDLRFEGYATGSSYLEFNSSSDPGVGYSNNIPFYAEIQPGTQEEIRSSLLELLGE